MVPSPARYEVNLVIKTDENDMRVGLRQGAQSVVFFLGGATI
jgi:hypothetical protein